jgi:hypothetical protein
MKDCGKSGSERGLIPMPTRTGRLSGTTIHQLGFSRRGIGLSLWVLKMSLLGFVEIHSLVAVPSIERCWNVFWPQSDRTARSEVL